MHSWAKLHSKKGAQNNATNNLYSSGELNGTTDKQTIDGHLKRDNEVRIFHQTFKKGITIDAV